MTGGYAIQSAVADLLEDESILCAKLDSLIRAHGYGLQRHPFGLELPRECQITVVADIGYTDVSVQGMLAVAKINLKMFPGQIHPFNLRIMRALVRITQEGERHHHVFFEIWSHQQSYICGGCTNCSGEGSWGLGTLERQFALMSALYQIPIIDSEFTASDLRAAEKYVKESQIAETRHYKLLGA
jgi:hypothetical protein